MTNTKVGTPFLYDANGNITGINQPAGPDQLFRLGDTTGNDGDTKVLSVSIGAPGAEVKITATPAEINAACGSSGLQQSVTATATEINATCDFSLLQQIRTDSGGITPRKRIVILDNTETAIAATISDAANHVGVFHIKTVTEPAAENNHTCTLTSGTWDGRNNTATFADAGDALTVIFDATGNGVVIHNNGEVALSLVEEEE